MYNIDFDQVIENLIPEKLRTNSVLAFFKSMVAPLNWLNQNVVYPWRLRMEKLLSYDGMTTHLERYLNNEYSLNYNPNTRGADITSVSIIYIETTANNAFRYVYNKAEQNPPIYLYNDAENSSPEYFYNLSEQPTFPPFTVWIPTSIGGTYEVNGTFDNLQIKAKIDTYRQAGATAYLIKRY